MGSWNNLGKKCTEFNDACVIFRACKIINKINSNPQRRAGLQTWFAPLGSPSICSHSGLHHLLDNVIFWRKLARLGTDLGSCWSAEIRADSYLSYPTRYRDHLFCYYFSWRNNANVRTLNRKWIKHQFSAGNGNFRQGKGRTCGANDLMRWGTDEDTWSLHSPSEYPLLHDMHSLLCLAPVDGGSLKFAVGNHPVSSSSSRLPALGSRLASHKLAWSGPAAAASCRY